MFFCITVSVYSLVRIHRSVHCVNNCESYCVLEEPQTVELSINGKTDKCSSGEDINFQFTGFGIVGKVCVGTDSVYVFTILPL